MEGPTRVLFVNSGILGPAAVAALVRETIARAGRIDARHIDIIDAYGAALTDVRETAAGKAVVAA